MRELICLCLPALMLAAASSPLAPAQERKPESVLYVFAHQDDEADVAAKIVTDLRNGRSVYAVWVTNGGRGGDPAARQKESLAVMDLLKVPRQNLFFLDYPDQGAYLRLEEITRDLIRIARRVSPVEIMSHAYEGGNIDHDAVSFVSTLAARAVNAVHLEFPDNSMYKGRIYIWRFLPGGGETLYTPMDPELFNLKMLVIHSYPSQAASMKFYELAMDKNHFKKFGEPYRVAPDYDYTKPPAEELRYASTSKGLATIEMWIEAVKNFPEKSGTDY